MFKSQLPEQTSISTVSIQKLSNIGIVFHRIWHQLNLQQNSLNYIPQQTNKLTFTDRFNVCINLYIAKLGHFSFLSISVTPLAQQLLIIKYNSCMDRSNCACSYVVQTLYFTNSNEELSSVQLPLTTISAAFARYPSTGSMIEPSVTPTTTCGQHESSLGAIRTGII